MEINLNVAIPDVTVDVSEYRIRCGETYVDITKYTDREGKWKPYNDWRDPESRVPLAYDDMVAAAKRFVEERETSRLMHLLLGVELGEI